MAVAGDGGTLRWQRGQVLGKGRHGVVYLALNEAKCACRAPARLLSPVRGNASLALTRVAGHRAAGR